MSRQVVEKEERQPLTGCQNERAPRISREFFTIPHYLQTNPHLSEFNIKIAVIQAPEKYKNIFYPFNYWDIYCARCISGSGDPLTPEVFVLIITM